MDCEHCTSAFTPKHPRARFCSTRCRLAAWHGKRLAKLETLETMLLRAVDQVRALRQAKSGQ